MVFRWLIYLLALGVSAWCQIYYTGYLVHLIFLVLLLLPWVSLALSLPVMLSLRVSLRTEKDWVPRGGPLVYHCETRSPTGLPLSKLRVRLRWTDRQSTGRPRRIVLEGWGSAGLEPPEEPLRLPHCGVGTLEIQRVQVWDALGLFVLRRPCPPPVDVLICPGETEADPFQGWERLPVSAQPLIPAPFGPGEDYDLRSYRPGDPLRSVHWKLSAKQDELIVREPLVPLRPALLLTFDHFGSREALDLRLELLQKASRRLLKEERPHLIRWLQPETGELRSFSIAAPADWERCRTAALWDPMPRQGYSIREGELACSGLEGPVERLHLEERQGSRS